MKNIKLAIFSVSVISVMAFAGCAQDKGPNIYVDANAASNSTTADGDMMAPLGTTQMSGGGQTGADAPSGSATFGNAKKRK